MVLTIAGADNSAGAGAQADLKTALTGADTYFMNAGGQSYAYLDSSAGGTSTISTVGTGLTYVSGPGAPNSSSSPHVISVYVPTGSNAIVLTALAHGSMDCWGILDIKQQLGTALDQETAVGTYYFVVQNSSASACNAKTVSPSAANVSSVAFPHG